MYLAVRSEAKGVQTRRLILDKTPKIEPQNLQWVKMDLTDMRSITAAVDWLQTQERKIDILSMSLSPNQCLEKTSQLLTI